MNKLVQFWNKAPLKTMPFVHPDDFSSIRDSVSPVSSYEDYVAALKNGSLDPTNFHLSLLPQPYMGDLDGADILVVLLNPGLHASDYTLEARHPEFRRRMIAVIRQEDRRHPFLDPDLAWTSGFSWWHRKLWEIARLVADQKFRGDYGRALDLLARRIAAVELVPYHSTSFRGSTNYPSARAAREFISDAVALGRQTVIVTRRARDWGAAASDKVILYAGGAARGASLSPRSRGGQAILTALNVSQ